MTSRFFVDTEVEFPRWLVYPFVGSDKCERIEGEQRSGARRRIREACEVLGVVVGRNGESVCKREVSRSL